MNHFLAPIIPSADFPRLGEDVDAVLVRRRIDESEREIRFEVDGGIEVDNIAESAAAGADTFVAGSAICGSLDYADTIVRMRAAAVRGRQAAPIACHAG